MFESHALLRSVIVALNIIPHGDHGCLVKGGENNLAEVISVATYSRLARMQHNIRGGA